MRCLQTSQRRYYSLGSYCLYKWAEATAKNRIMWATSIEVIHAFSFFRSGMNGRMYAEYLAMAVGVHILSWFFTVTLTTLYACAISQGRLMSWYTNSWLLLFLYIAPAVFCLLGFHFAASKKILKVRVHWNQAEIFVVRLLVFRWFDVAPTSSICSQNFCRQLQKIGNTWNMEQVFYDAHMVLMTWLLAASTYKGINSALLFLQYVSCPLLLREGLMKILRISPKGELGSWTTRFWTSNGPPTICRTSLVRKTKNLFPFRKHTNFPVSSHDWCFYSDLAFPVFITQLLRNVCAADGQNRDSFPSGYVLGCSVRFDDHPACWVPGDSLLCLSLKTSVDWFWKRSCNTVVRCVFPQRIKTLRHFQHNSFSCKILCCRSALFTQRIQPAWRRF